MIAKTNKALTWTAIDKIKNNRNKKQVIIEEYFVNLTVQPQEFSASR